METGNTLWRSVAGVVLATALILVLPLVAARFTDQVAWNVADFVTAGVLLAGTGLLYVLAARRAGAASFRWGLGLALATALLLVWANLAVRLIGSEANPANLLYLGVLAVGMIGVIVARLEPGGMARALFATAAAQALVAVIAWVGHLGSPGTGPLEILGGNGLFVVLWVGSGLLFRRAAREPASPGVALN